MCMSCGCKMPNEDHGDARNITMRDLEMAAETQNMSPGDVVQNISESYREFGPVESAVGAQSREGFRGSSGEASGVKAAESIERVAREAGRAASEGRGGDQ